MKKFALVLLALATAVAISPKASADPMLSGTIDITGGDAITATSITMFNPATIMSIGTTGSFAPLAGHSVTLDSFSTPPVTMLTDLADGLSFVLESYNIVIETANKWEITGTGVFSLTGYADTPSNFIFDTNDTAGGSAEVSFTATAAATPEPTSLLLLGSGLLGLALTFRKTLMA
jgi:hypothetical protein